MNLRYLSGKCNIGNDWPGDVVISFPVHGLANQIESVWPMIHQTGNLMKDVSFFMKKERKRKESTSGETFWHAEDATI